MRLFTLFLILLSANAFSSEADSVRICKKLAPGKYYVAQTGKPSLFGSLNWICNEASQSKNIDPIACMVRWRAELDRPDYTAMDNRTKNVLLGKICRASRADTEDFPNSDKYPTRSADFENTCAERFTSGGLAEKLQQEGLRKLLVRELCKGADSYAPTECLERAFRDIPSRDYGVADVVRLCRAPDAASNLSCFLEAVDVVPKGNFRAVDAINLCERGAGTIPVQCYRAAIQKKILPSVAIQNICAGAKGLDVFQHPMMKK